MTSRPPARPLSSPPSAATSAPLAWFVPRAPLAQPAAVAAMAAMAAMAVLPTRQAGAQQLGRADSALVGRVLLAEDRRDTSDAALREAAAHADPRVRALAARARGRIGDPRFESRSALPALPAPPVWVEPAWRIRYRALTALRDDCAALLLAAGDSAWPVRFRAAAVARESCARDEALVQTFVRWVRDLPRDASARKRGAVAWQGAAHGLLALARLRPDEARRVLPALAAHRVWHLRQYAARAATTLGDTATLRRLAADRDDNVAEAAIEGLARTGGHAHDDLYLAALDRQGAQAVRAAAMALKGTSRTAAATTALAVHERWVRRDNESELDARAALLELAGRPAAAAALRPHAPSLPPQAVALALGRELRLRVTMARTSGGGTFDVRLRGDVAPIMAARLYELARRGYYDGLTWHRVEHDFVIQGGSPGANEYVGYPDFLRDELGTVSHARGTLGMSTRGHDTGDAQWFVNLRDNARLDRDYTVWGEIVAGIAVVDGVLEGDVIRRIRPIRP